MREWGQLVTNCATQEKCDTMAAGIRMAKMVDGMNVVMILAATVELIEPSHESMDDLAVSDLQRQAPEIDR